MEENSSSILVVDDNPEIREIIQVLLGGEGYLVETAGNGVKALEMLENREYDLIILDAGNGWISDMPEDEGRE